MSKKKSNTQKTKIGEWWKYFFLQPRGINALVKNAEIYVANISEGEKISSFLADKSFTRNVNICRRNDLQIVGTPPHGIFYAVLERNLNPSLIPSELKHEESYRNYVAIKQDIMDFLQGLYNEPRKGGPQQFFSYVLHAAIFYWLGQINLESFRVYALSKRRVTRTTDDNYLRFQGNADNLLFHIAVMDAHSRSQDFRELCESANDFLDYISIRGISENEVIQKLDNWLLRLDRSLQRGARCTKIRTH